MDKQQTAYERLKVQVDRIGWRIQYRAKTIRKREYSFYDLEYMRTDVSFTDGSENRMMIEQLINTLPPQGKLIIYKLYIQDQTESEVALQLNMSQQAVNKWKRKMIEQLSQTVSS
ncbi:RNA polymerase sigma factor, sigma-70 family [Paenibacillus uliginis N3/975]|uniref:RNA polymerase sigma factor, sigma-70 family n=1 Tax=Paenibacillus uliginis N3/975 TaxID=1313296 RepID=A0A1X7HP38_9BACL|nr:sigma factor-like helix-turn-helix DNA-binding protein [Paenibacillus uliginis]SMF90293.1 RNA polymerase sigma factor, sigma-70 family [Paenibacillus uliginis N3/975]